MHVCVHACEPLADEGGECSVPVSPNARLFLSFRQIKTGHRGDDGPINLPPQIFFFFFETSVLVNCAQTLREVMENEAELQVGEVSDWTHQVSSSWCVFFTCVSCLKRLILILQRKLGFLPPSAQSHSHFFAAAHPFSLNRLDGVK